MNIEKLKRFESQFLMRYPDGFDSPEMVELVKKHKMDKLIALAQTSFKVEAFEDPETICKQLVKLVCQSSMVSLFEKPKFRDGIQAMSYDEREALSEALKNLLYGNEEEGFNQFVGCLYMKKLAKWPIVTASLVYLRPNTEILVKPTTVKGIIKTLELEDLVYKPSPSYDFYNRYREAINKMKTLVDPSLAPSNAAFSGFLMMFIEEKA